MKVWRSRQSVPQALSRSVGLEAPGVAAQVHVEVVAAGCWSAIPRSMSPKMKSSSLRTQWTWTTSLSAVAAVELAHHAHDRGDPAAGADEERLLGERVGQAEGPLDLAEVDHRVLADLAGEVRRHLALLDALDGDRDEVPRVVGVGGDRVGAPVADAVDLGADPQVLAGLVAGPRGARLDRRRWSRRRSRADRLDDPPAQLARRPERVQQLDVVVGQRAASSAPRAARRKLRRSGETFGSAPFSTNSRSRSLSFLILPTVGKQESTYAVGASLQIRCHDAGGRSSRTGDPARRAARARAGDRRGDAVLGQDCAVLRRRQAGAAAASRRFAPPGS